MDGVALDPAELKEMRDNIRREVFSLELCWKCQRISSCKKTVLGETVIVWVCKTCLHEAKQLLKIGKIPFPEAAALAERRRTR